MWGRGSPHLKAPLVFGQCSTHSFLTTLIAYAMETEYALHQIRSALFMSYDIVNLILKKSCNYESCERDLCQRLS